MLLVLMAFASCQRGPVMYEMAEKPSQVINNVEKFVKQTEKKAKHYSAEDWRVAFEQFVAMAKNFVENKDAMKEEEVIRFDAARLEFMKTVTTNGNEELAAQIKEVYATIIND